MAKPLLEVLRDVSLDPTERAAFTADPSRYLADHGYEDVPAEHLNEAFGLMHDTLPAETAQALVDDPVYEIADAGAGDTLDLDDAAEVGDLAPFGEVNGDFDSAPDEEGPDDAGDGDADDLDDGEGGLDDDLDLDDGDVLIGDGYRSAADLAADDTDDLDTGDLDTSDVDTGDLDSGGTDEAGLDLGDDGLGFGLGSGDVGDDDGLALDPDGPGDAGPDDLAPEGPDGDGGDDIDDVDGFDLPGGVDVLGLGDPLAPDLDADFADDVDGHDLDDRFDTDDFDDLDGAENLPDGLDGIDDIGSF